MVWNATGVGLVGTLIIKNYPQITCPQAIQEVPSPRPFGGLQDSEI